MKHYDGDIVVSHNHCRSGQQGIVTANECSRFAILRSDTRCFSSGIHVGKTNFPAPATAVAQNPFSPCSFSFN